MTDTNTTDETEEDRPMTMRDVDHTHPYDDTTARNLFLRGPVIAADGGRDPSRNGADTGADDDTNNGNANTDADVNSDMVGTGNENENEIANATARSESVVEAETMKDVDHTPTDGDGVNRVFERGEEHSVEE